MERKKSGGSLFDKLHNSKIEKRKSEYLDKSLQERREKHQSEAQIPRMEKITASDLSIGFKNKIAK